jgi:hypothetical protein
MARCGLSLIIARIRSTRRLLPGIDTLRHKTEVRLVRVCAAVSREQRVFPHKTQNEFADSARPAMTCCGKKCRSNHRSGAICHTSLQVRRKHRKTPLIPLDFPLGSGIFRVICQEKSIWSDSRQFVKKPASFVRLQSLSKGMAF